MTRHTREDALSQRKFELLLEGVNRLDYPQALHARFVVLVGGRLGLCADEICHTTDSWLNWRQKMIRVPGYDDCQKELDGELCGYCPQQAKQKLTYETGMTEEQAFESMWSAKTETAQRAVLFDFDPRVKIVIQRLFNEYDIFPRSRASVNRWETSAAEHAPGLNPERIYPHALRLTAASYHAARGIDLLLLLDIRVGKSRNSSNLFEEVRSIRPHIQFPAFR